MHRVTAVIPVYNEQRFVVQCLESIRSSLGSALQVIVVDDGSTDDSAELASRFIERAARDPHSPDFQFIRKPNGGYGSAVNLGFSQADGDYVGIVEPDDYLRGDLFGSLSDIARASFEPDVVKSCYWRVWMPDTPDERVWHSLLRHRGVRTWRMGTVELGDAPQLVRWHPSVWSAIYRRDFLQASGTRFIEAPGAGWVDNPFVMRAMCQARTIAYTDEAWYCYREDHPTSSSVLKGPDLPLVRWRQMAEEVAASRWADDEDVLAVLYSIAFQHLRHLWNAPECPSGTAELAREVARSMNPRIALGIDEVSPALKRRYLQEGGHAGSVPSARRYYAFLGREFAHSLRENGPAFALLRAGRGPLAKAAARAAETPDAAGGAHARGTHAAAATVGAHAAAATGDTHATADPVAAEVPARDVPRPAARGAHAAAAPSHAAAAPSHAVPAAAPREEVRP